MHRKYLSILAAVVLAVSTLQACSGGGGTSPGSGATAMGTATISLTDAPGDFDHVFITVKDVWFHSSDAAGPDDAGWLKYPLSSPVTVDLLTLSSGTVGNPTWGNINLPVGHYQQMRLFLTPTFAQNPPTGHLYYNEVVDSTGTHPLRIPDAEHGIRLAGSFDITNGGTLRLAIDFDAGHDVVDITRTVNGVTITECVLKPRLAYFDLDDAGAIVGSIDALASTQTSTARFVFKAEQVVSDPTATVMTSYHVVRRVTAVADTATGKFIFYPLRPGTYDIVMRGLNYETVIIKGVPVTKGTTPLLGATVIPQITLTGGSDYTVTATNLSPTGSWVQFYQTLSGDAPYEIRFRHANPLSGSFPAFALSQSQLRVGTYVDAVNPPSFISTDPQEGAGGFSAVAGAFLYKRSVPVTVTPSSNTNLTSPLFGGALTPQSFAVPFSIQGTIYPPMGMGMMWQMNSGVLFAVQGGMIVDALDNSNYPYMSGCMMNGGTYTMNNIPGGFPWAFYGVEAIGWSSSSTSAAVAVPRIADLRTGSAASINMNMMPF